MNEQKKMNAVRHIEDIDDLRENRDGSINWEKKEDALGMASQIIKEAQDSDSEIIFFATSPKKRVQETTVLVRDEIRRKTNLKTVLTVEKNIREIDQGEFRLPENYTYGVFIPELKKAWEVFWDETFNRGNFTYRFGSTENGKGEKEYADLENFFITPGENYTEFCLRLYTSVLEMARNPNLIDREKVKIVVMTHSAPLAIFKELEDVARKILTENFDFATGTLMQTCWDNFKKREVDVAANFGYVESISIGYLCNPVILKKLEEEILFMKKSLNK